MQGPHELDFVTAALDAVPYPLFVVDDDVKIIAFNHAASSLLGDTPTFALSTRGGEALHCIHATEAIGGCGASEACKSCVVRTSVVLSCRDRVAVRRPQRMQLVGAEGARDVYLLVTTNPIQDTDRHRAVLMFQDIGELVSTQGLVPICMHCGKVRDLSNQWAPMEQYLKDRLDLGVTHGLCPVCLKKHYPDYAADTDG
jgi:nitrogen fixation/metabolism regulation signal transduction histidine kinase